MTEGHAQTRGGAAPAASIAEAIAAYARRSRLEDSSTPTEYREFRATYFAQTDTGLVRAHNEDNFVVYDLASGNKGGAPQAEGERSISSRGFIFAVCDGMGGAAAGEVASQLAVDTLCEAMRIQGVSSSRDEFARQIVVSIQAAGRKIFESARAERSRRGMGTTATVAGLVDDVLFLGEVGDSRAYILRKGELVQVTKDQSLVNQLIEAGQLTEEEAAVFEHSNIILQALGTSESVSVDLTSVQLRSGDRLLICSDGLSGLVPDELLASTLEDIGSRQECADQLIELAKENGGHDNITVILVDFDGEGLRPPETDDVLRYAPYVLEESSGDEEAAEVDDVTRRIYLPKGEEEDELDDFSGDDGSAFRLTGHRGEAGGMMRAGAALSTNSRSELDDAKVVGSSLFGRLVLFIGVVAIVSVAFLRVPRLRGLVAHQNTSDDLVAVDKIEDPADASPKETNRRAPVEVEAGFAGSLFIDGRFSGELAPARTLTFELAPATYVFEVRAKERIMSSVRFTVSLADDAKDTTLHQLLLERDSE